jgi:6-phosphofructokinase 1
MDRFLTKIEAMQKDKKSIVVAVSEGVKLPDGRYVCELSNDAAFIDAFGHRNLTGTARYLCNEIAKNMDTRVRSVELSTLQRCAGHLTSRTDITEAYQVGGAAAKAAFEGTSGKMVALKRLSDEPYQCTTELVDIEKEIARLTKEKKRLEGELARSNGMLHNERFLSKAPAQKVAQEKEKLAKYEQLMAQVMERLSQLAK